MFGCSKHFVIYDSVILMYFKILFRWRGSVYKLVYKEMLAYIIMYMIINLTYR